MTRSQSAYLRAVKAALSKMGKADRFNATRAIAMYDAWVKAPAAAAQLADLPKLAPVSVEEAGCLLASVS